MTQTAPSLRLPSRTSLAAFAALAFMLIALQAIMRATSTGDYEKFSARHADLLGSPARATTAGGSCTNLASGSPCTLTWTIPANQPVGNYTLNARVTDANGQAATVARVITLNPAVKITYYHTDPLGSPVLATDAAGNAVWREGYGAFGERLKKPTAADNVGRVWQIRGKQNDNASGLSYFGARWYDPAIGRFMGYDPAGFDEGNPGSFNRYGYGNNNPYKFVDPDGRLSVIAYAAIVYAPEIAAAVGAGFAAMRAAPALARFTASSYNTLTQVANSPTTHAVVEAAAGLASGVPGPTSGVASAISKSVSPASLLGRQGRDEMTQSTIRGLTNSMRQGGYKGDPIEVAIVNGKMIIIDGHHRAAAASKAGLKEVPVNVNQVTREQADQLLREAAEVMTGK